MLRPIRTVVVGGGAAGFFAAIACAGENPRGQVRILEKTSQTLGKVRISGGGRCNVTHACFDPARLVGFYPRGGAALRGPYSRFQPQDTVNWFQSRGVALKTESDGRMFPATNQSQTIVDCLNEEARRSGVTVETHQLIQKVGRSSCASDPEFELTLGSGEILLADRLILATGSNPKGWEWARSLGHDVAPPVPSLFTFTVKDPRLEGLAGISVSDTALQIERTLLAQSGPLLITHWGLSGPAVLRLSAWGARVLHELSYRAELKINWLPGLPPEALTQELKRIRTSQSRRAAPGEKTFGIPRRLWTRLAEAAGIRNEMRWTEISNGRLSAFVRELQEGRYTISGKSTFKDEFVTCGGVRLDEVDFRTMESKRCPNLFFAGEILDIDGVTGGFNFQSAWTTGWIAGKAAARIR